MKSITNSVSLWFKRAMFTYAPFAIASSIWSWICSCWGICPCGGLSAMPASSMSICRLGDGGDACLLLHGLTGSPAEVRPVGEALAGAGFRALGPLLPGHGTSPRDLETVTRFDVEDAAREALLSLRGARRVYLCGLSMGALLAV